MQLVALYWSQISRLINIVKIIIDKVINLLAASRGPRRWSEWGGKQREEQEDSGTVPGYCSCGTVVISIWDKRMRDSITMMEWHWVVEALGTVVAEYNSWAGERGYQASETAMGLV